MEEETQRGSGNEHDIGQMDTREPRGHLRPEDGMEVVLISISCEGSASGWVENEMESLSLPFGLPPDPLPYPPLWRETS